MISYTLAIGRRLTYCSGGSWLDRSVKHTRPQNRYWQRSWRRPGVSEFDQYPAPIGATGRRAAPGMGHKQLAGANGLFYSGWRVRSLDLHRSARCHKPAGKGGRLTFHYIGADFI